MLAMKKKLLGLSFLLSVVAMLVACGDSSNADESEDCLLNPSAPGCSTDEGDVDSDVAK